VYHVYILECGNGSLYTGITTDLARRLEQHRSGKGGNYTRSKGVKRIVYSEKAANRSVALRREAEIKGWTRQKKLELIQFGRV